MRQYFYSSLLVLAFLSLLFIAFNGPGIAKEKSFCDYPQAEKEWQELLKKYPGDKGINLLHTLRIGLWEKIDRGQISVKEATVIFEEARTNLIETIKHRQKYMEKKGIL